jgi:hypothetical protein
MNKKVVALLALALAALIGLAVGIERTARPTSDRAGVMAEGEGEGHSH